MKNCQRIILGGGAKDSGTVCGHSPDQHARVGSAPFFVTGLGPCNVINPDGTGCTCYQFSSVKTSDVFGRGYVPSVD